MRRALIVFALTACGEPTSPSRLGEPCALDNPCGDAEVCDLTADEGPLCIEADGDLDGDGIPNDRDFCNHVAGGAEDEDQDGIGDVCDRCPIAPPRATPDPDGDAVDAPCDPDPFTPGDEILLFESFSAATLGARWQATTAGAWTVRGGELVGELAFETPQFLTTDVVGKNSIAIQTTYRVDRLEPSATQHVVGVYASDPRPAGSAFVQCGTAASDVTQTELVTAESNQGTMSAPVERAFDSARLYRTGAYVTGLTASCAVIADGEPLGVVQAPITPDQLTRIALAARAVTVRFQNVLVVGR